MIQRKPTLRMFERNNVIAAVSEVNYQIWRTVILPQRVFLGYAENAERFIIPYTAFFTDDPRRGEHLGVLRTGSIADFWDIARGFNLADATLFIPVYQDFPHERFVPISSPEQARILLRGVPPQCDAAREKLVETMALAG